MMRWLCAGDGDEMEMETGTGEGFEMTGETNVSQFLFWETKVILP